MKTKFFPYVLTIGMIVKNEAHRLRTCLDGLAPLRQAISCELIITDLGSTDGTQDIAKEYADVYLEHQWQEDFSLARNTGVKMAKGRWFFYVDGDYVFDDSLLDIATFVSQKKQSKIYNSATVTLRNRVPSTEEGGVDDVYDLQRGLLVNFSEGKRFFKSAVHESIPTYGVAYPLKTVISRINARGEDVEAQREQNRLMMEKQLEKEPDDLKHYIEITQNMKDPVAKNIMFQKGMEKSKSLPKSNSDNVLWTAILHGRYLLFALREENWTLFEELYTQWNNPFPHSIIDLNVQGMGVAYAIKIEDVEELMARFTPYQALFYQLKKKPDQIFSMIEPFTYARAPFFYSVECNAISQVVALQEYDLGAEWMKQSDTYTYVHRDGTRVYLDQLILCAVATEEFTVLKTVYDYFQEQGTEEEQESFERELSSHYFEFSEYTKFLFEQVFEGCSLFFLGGNGEQVALELPEIFQNTDISVSENGFSLEDSSLNELSWDTFPQVSPVDVQNLSGIEEEKSTMVEKQPTLEERKTTLLTLLQKGDLETVKQLLPKILAEFPEDVTFLALKEKLAL